jgi:alpha-L-rhamnosidase/F5/8 type C domain
MAPVKAASCTALLALVCSLPALSVHAQAPVSASPQPAATLQQDPLLAAFQNPPNSARPRVWWHWMNGNISQEGLRLDLEWMHRIGLGGVTIFEAGLRTPQAVPQRLIYMTPEWKQAFTYAVKTAKDLGLEVAISSSPGWSETGGPWVPASQAMKKMVWSVTRVEGGKTFTGMLPQPPQVDGSFQNSVDPPRFAGGQRLTLPEFYQDAAVIAYRLPDGDKTQSELSPQITSSGGTANLPALSDGDVNTVALELPAESPGTQSWIQFDYGQPQTIQAITLATIGDTADSWERRSIPIPPRLEASDDGQNWRKIADLIASTIVQRTIAFDPVTARYFRVVFETAAEAQTPQSHRISELALTTGARVNQFEKRAGFAIAQDYYSISDPKVAPEFIVPPTDVIDLTTKMQPDGSFEWTPPAGIWIVLRIGASLIGHVNGPAPAEATGLEVDKLNGEYVKNYLDGYLKMYSDTVGPSLLGKQGVTHLLTDSIESGPQNWTDHILDEFQQRRGYDPHPWLPALTGVVIKSPEDTDKFLWDYRRTIAQLVAENHYGQLASELHSNNLSYYSEALEEHRPMLGDDMEMRSHADIPMGAVWTWEGEPGPEASYIADARGAASVAHIYGQNIAAAESMTSRGPAWAFSPALLKKVADLEFALGINLFQIHESAHQPVPDMAPGLTLGPFGLWFNRNDTWAEEAGPWVTYLSRCSYLLQQGHYFADVAYFYGEEGPLTGVFGDHAPPDAPEGYAYDFINSDAILNHLTIQNGRWQTSGGTSYRVLYLGGASRRITLPTLRKLRDLVAQGGIIVGDAPVDSPSLADDPEEFHRIVDQLWNRKPLVGRIVRPLKGKVISGMTPNQALESLNEPKDFDYTKPSPDTNLMFLHRSLPDGELYFIDNRTTHAEDVSATFRVEGKLPELWDPATASTQAASYNTADHLTTVPLHLDPWGTTFVVFRKVAQAPSLQLPVSKETELTALDDSLNRNWIVSFESGRGAPESAPFDSLISWSDHPDNSIKYFSGNATYTKTFQLPASARAPGTHLWLDLGDVKDLAEVAVNGKYFGVLWKAPFKVDITSALQPGQNQLVLQVTNLWVNRLIGDQQAWSMKKYAFTDFVPYKADSPLLPSGLLGPIKILSTTEQ